MRVLFSTTANDGHFGPMVSLARATASAGHDVKVVAPASFAAAITRAGFDHLPFADADPELVGPVMARLSSLPFEQADATVIREIFGRIDAQAALPGVTEAIERWRPYVVVREPAEFGSLAAACRAGIPHLQVAIGMTEACRDLVAQTTDPLRELAGLAGVAEDDLIGAATTEPSLSPVPDALDRAGDDAYVDTVAFRYRDAAPTLTTEPLPSWGDPDAPLVYVTFGSVTGLLPPFAGVFRQALDGLADLPVRVLMTVGRRVDLGSLGPFPSNARVEAWRPQEQVLVSAAAMLGHGGFGTTMGALAAGVPQVVAPIFSSDQRINARHVAAVGAGRAVEPGPDVIERACREVMATLEDRSYRESARAMAAAIAALPPAAEAVAVIERHAG